ncbi:MAG: SRPBCC domain-containing protein [Burkholderiaceae bacterium]
MAKTHAVVLINTQGEVIVDILHRVGIKSPLDEVYKAVATREGLAGWWTNNTQGESKVGATLQFRFEAGGVEIGGMDMKVLELQPAQQVQWQVLDGPAEWIGTRISWELKQDGDYCIVLFKHQGWKEPVEFMHHCSTKWAIFLMSLKSLVETGKGAPNPNDIKIDNWN